MPVLLNLFHILLYIMAARALVLIALFSSWTSYLQVYCCLKKKKTQQTCCYNRHLNKTSPGNLAGLWLFKGNYMAVTALGQVLQTLHRPCSIVASLIHSLGCFAVFLVPLHSLFFLLSPSVLLVPEHYQMSVLESAPISSTVGRVVAKDLDEGINAEMKYSLVDGDGLDVFDINTDPNYQVGIITVRKVKKLPFYSNFYG